MTNPNRNRPIVLQITDYYNNIKASYIICEILNTRTHAHTHTVTCAKNNTLIIN